MLSKYAIQLELGASKTKYKIIAVYVVFLNLPPHLRTKKENIQLVILCLDSYIKRFGWGQILKKCVNDLKELSTQGISVVINGDCKTFVGVLMAMLADNLGSHQIGGYVENFSKSLNFCRYCEITRQEFYDNVFRPRHLRTVQSYIECVQEAERKGTIVKGIKQNSALNELNNFHVQSSGLPPCLAHGIFEGFVKRDMFLVIQYFVNKIRWFKEGLLNYRLNDMKLLSENAVFIPSVKVIGTVKKKLDGTASQIRRLVLLFPEAVADKVKDFDDPVWRMLMHLRAI